MKKDNNKKAGYYDRLIVRVVEQSNKMQQYYKKDVPEAGREDAAETVRRLATEFQVFENELRAARQACLIDAPVKETECLDEAYKKFLHLGWAISNAPRIKKAAKEGYFRELRAIGKMIDAMMDRGEVTERELQRARTLASPAQQEERDGSWLIHLVKEMKEDKKNRAH